MKTLKIIQPKACIVLENVQIDTDGNETIKKHSALNCGACGGYLGTMTSDIGFPFALSDFKSRISNIGFSTGKYGLKCNKKKCRAILFTDLTKIVFTTKDNFRNTQRAAFNEMVQPSNKLFVQK